MSEQKAEPGSTSADDVKEELGPNLCQHLDFKQSKNLLRIKPKGYLGATLFKDIADAIKACGGSYSKEEHLFKVWLKVGEKPPTRRPKRRALVDIIKDFQSLVTELEAWVE